MTDAGNGPLIRRRTILRIPPWHMGIAIVSRKGGKRKVNQDRFVAATTSDEGFLAAVADGMGGEAAGDVAAQTASDSLEKIDHVPRGRECSALADRFKNIDHKIFAAALRNPALKNMGTTLTGVFIRQDRACFAHVGDSRLCLFRGGRLFRKTRDHTFAQFLYEEGEITREQLSTHYSRHILDQCVGHGECRPETGTIRLRDTDLLLLSSDGVHKVLSDDTIARVLDRCNPKAGEILVREAVAAGGTDDMTLVLIRVSANAFYADGPK